MRYIGIDLGSSFVKGAVLDLDAASLHGIERFPFPHPVEGLAPSFREYDPVQVSEATRGVLERLLSAAPDASGVVLCSQLHGLVFTDPSGRPLSRFISWQDQRALQPWPGGGGTYFDEVNRRVGEEDRRRLGNEARPGVPLCFLFWLAERRGLPPQSNAIPASLANHVVAHLCGCEPVSDVTNAYAHGLLDVTTLDWHRGVAERVGLGTVAWPRIVAQGAVIGEYPFRGRRVPIHAPVGDYHCSQVGAFLQEDELSVNISTGSAVIRMARGCEFGPFQTRPWFDGRYLKTITHIPAGRALNALVQLLTELARSQGAVLADPWDHILAEAEAAAGTDLRVDPAFYFSAMGDHGSITNLREENMRVGPLFRATLEGMADNYARCAERISPSRDWSRIVFSGGLAMKTRLLRDLVAGRLGSAHRLAASEEDTLLGLLVLATAFSGRAPGVVDAIRAVAARFSA